MTPKRPELLGEFVARETAEAMLQPVLAYGRKRGTPNKDLTELFLDQQRQQLTIAVLNYKTPREMVAFMRGTSTDSVPEDDELVKIMSNVRRKRGEVYHRLIKSWVKDNLVTAKRRVGENIKFNHAGIVEQGEITKIDDETAQYVVFCAHVGHVRTGVGAQGYYVNYEDVL